MSEICATCAEEVVNENYTINGGLVYVCSHEPGAVEHSLGECGVQTFTYTPTYVEHFRGRDGAFDAALPVRANFELMITIHEITIFNLSTALGVMWIPTATGCKIPFKKPDCGRHYGVRFEHTFPCASKWFLIHLWAALVMGDFSLEFGETIVEFPITFRATDCAGTHPADPYGNMEIESSCPAT